MRKQIKLKQTITIFVALACIFLCVGMGYELFLLGERGQFYNEFPRSIVDPDLSADYGMFEIDPETLLLSLDRGETEMFNPMIATPEVYTPLAAGSFPWTQSDYLKIASALAQIKRKENLNDWHVFSMLFEKDCSTIPKGFDAGWVVYFKLHNKDGTPDYFHYQTDAIAIFPLSKNMKAGRDYFPRPLLGWTSINVNSLKVTADDALQIAEEKGGEKTRLKLNNICKISVFNSPSSGDNDWIVRYEGRFEIHIDPYSGEYKIIDKSK